MKSQHSGCLVEKRGAGCTCDIACGEVCSWVEQQQHQQQELEQQQELRQSYGGQECSGWSVKGDLGCVDGESKTTITTMINATGGNLRDAENMSAIRTTTALPLSLPISSPASTSASASSYYWSTASPGYILGFSSLELATSSSSPFPSHSSSSSSFLPYFHTSSSSSTATPTATPTTQNENENENANQSQSQNHNQKRKQKQSQKQHGDMYSTHYWRVIRPLQRGEMLFSMDMQVQRAMAVVAGFVAVEKGDGEGEGRGFEGMLGKRVERLG